MSIPEIHGHRGCRGLLPENTLPAFLKAAELGVTALELDVVLSADEQVLVSHEPWMSHRICLTPEGAPIPEAEEHLHNLYRMPYSRIRQYDCGSLQHPDFPEQQVQQACKPLLSEVVDTVDRFLHRSGRNSIHYNIEVKSQPDWYDTYQPGPEAFVQVLVAQLRALSLPAERLLLQSFDEHILQQLHRQAPGLTLGLLVEEPEPVADSIARLGFLPGYYNPHYLLLSPETLAWCHKRQIKVVPWTVNEQPDMLRLLRMGVDGLITDYPGRALSCLGQMQ